MGFVFLGASGKTLSKYLTARIYCLRIGLKWKNTILLEVFIVTWKILDQRGKEFRHFIEGYSIHLDMILSFVTV